jgi:hypothetical protein
LRLDDVVLRHRVHADLLAAAEKAGAARLCRQATPLTSPAVGVAAAQAAMARP